MLLLSFLVVFASATQDIVLDAFRVESFENQEQGAGAAVFILGYRIGSIFSGAVALLLAEFMTWNQVYVLMSLGVIVGIATVALSPEPKDMKAGGESTGGSLFERLKRFFAVSVKNPLADFAGRRHWGLILLFVMLYKLCDAYMVPMTMPFYKDMGFIQNGYCLYYQILRHGGDDCRRYCRRDNGQPLGNYQKPCGGKPSAGTDNADVCGAVVCGRQYLRADGDDFS